MKKYLILFAVLAFGLCACEADGGSGSSSGRLEGSWKVYKAELLFNGKVVEQADPSDPDFDMGLEYSFSDGYMTVRDSEETLHYPIRIRERPSRRRRISSRSRSRCGN